MTSLKNPFDVLKKNYEDTRKTKNEYLQLTLKDTNYTYGEILYAKKNEFDEKWRKKKPSTAENIRAYEKIKVLGSGSFGRVYLVKNILSKEYYAMKVMEKEKILRQKQLEHTYNEKRLLQCIEFPFVVNMVEAMKDNSNIYFVMPFIGGGEMFIHLRKAETFTEEVSRFYASQVVLALEYLHYLDLIFRDLKPENIVVETNGYLRLTDFGFCKMVKGRTWTLCGTPEYIAPEIVLSKGYGKSVDWWSFGVLVYEMNAGFPPFFSRDHMRLYEKIVAGKYKFPSHFSHELKEIVRCLLQVDLTRRYGNLKGGIDDIKNSLWFSSINFLDIYQQKFPSPFVPVSKTPEEIPRTLTDEENNIVVSEIERYAKEFSDF